MCKSLILEGEALSTIYSSKKSVRTAMPNSRNAKYSLYLGLRLLWRRRMPDDDILHVFMDTPMGNIAGRWASIIFQLRGSANNSFMFLNLS
jgi:hypothetical protein